MPTALGSKPPATEDPFALLFDCHARIRRFTALASKLAAVPAGTPPLEVSGAAADVMRYFSLALPLHEQDEELSLAPRLGERELPGAARAALVRLAPEHREIEDVIGTLAPRWRAIVQDPAEAGSALAEPSRRLSELFDAHLLHEERDLFPAAQRVMNAAELAEMLAEMRARRS